MTTAEQTPTNGPPGEEPIHVLLVDDSRDLIEVVAQLIERDHDDIRVTTATSAVTAFGELAGGDIDCIVSDYRMPAVDGLEFLQAVRERDRDVSFILFTNKGSDEVADAALRQGVTAYVPKDTDPEYGRLVERIREAATDPSLDAP